MCQVPYLPMLLLLLQILPELAIVVHRAQLAHKVLLVRKAQQVLKAQPAHKELQEQLAIEVVYLIHLAQPQLTVILVQAV